MRWYLAGPMTGIPQHNIPAFDEAAIKLRSHGYDIISPAELDAELRPEFREQALADETGLVVPDGLSHGEVVARDVRMIADEADGIIFLPGWQKSKGARLEAYIALLYGKRFARYENGSFSPMPKTVLQAYLIGGINAS